MNASSNHGNLRLALFTNPNPYQVIPRQCIIYSEKRMVGLEEFLSCILSIVLYLIRLIKARPMATRFQLIPFSSPSPLFTRIIFNQLLGSKSQVEEDSEACYNVEKMVAQERDQRRREALDRGGGFRRNSPENQVFEFSGSGAAAVGNAKLRNMRPSMLLVPEYSPIIEFQQERTKVDRAEFEIQGRDYCLVSRKGRRENMEDRYQIITDIAQDPNQVFFAVIDGHGGHAAAEYVAGNLGKNIVKALDQVGRVDAYGVEQAIREGYSVTDKEFLAQGVRSGACVASVLLRDGVLHVANVGDCRVVLGRNGQAYRLTNDHHPSREDERSRVEDLGGYVDCHNGVWRVEGSLAVSRAIGDLHLKKWIISEPEVVQVRPTSDCEFLVVASDGLWNMVDELEAVDMVTRDGVSIKSCKKLVDTSCSRGNKDDITVMLIKLQKLVDI